MLLLRFYGCFIERKELIVHLHLQMEVERSNRIERSVRNHKVKLFLAFGACNRLLMQTTQISIQIDFFSCLFCIQKRATFARSSINKGAKILTAYL